MASSSIASLSFNGLNTNDLLPLTNNDMMCIEKHTKVAEIRDEVDSELKFARAEVTNLQSERCVVQVKVKLVGKAVDGVEEVFDWFLGKFYVGFCGTDNLLLGLYLG
ncbi:hypothetical protein L1887_26683 [Cichorium endivia]|nr:hypothetical protein L1887_26683 [Cichorium endivia]